MACVRPGDAVIVTGWLGNHSIHILSLREGLGFEQRMLSDCAPLDGLVWNVLEDYAAQVHCMRDITRGGLGTVLNELADGARVSIRSSSAAYRSSTRPRWPRTCSGSTRCTSPTRATSACSSTATPPNDILELIRWHPHGRAAQIVGTVRERAGSAVTMGRADGTEAVVELLYGAELPRLC